MPRISTAIVALAATISSVAPAMAQHMDNRPGQNTYERANQHGEQRMDDRRDDDQHRQDDRRMARNNGRHRGHWQGAGNPFRNGERFDYRRAPNYRVVAYRQYRLRKPPRGYHWVQSGNDALLVAIATGVIASIAANQF